MALHAMGLVAMAEQDAPLSASAVAKRLEASLHTARTVMRRLGRARLVRTGRGRRGGFRLGRPAAGITLWDVVDIFEPRPRGRECLFVRPVCARGTSCPFAGLAGELQRRIEAYLRDTTLENVAAVLADHTERG